MWKSKNASTLHYNAYPYSTEDLFQRRFYSLLKRGFIGSKYAREKQKGKAEYHRMGEKKFHGAVAK